MLPKDSCVVVAIDDPGLRVRVERALAGVSGVLQCARSLEEGSRRPGEMLGRSVIVVGSRVAGMPLAPAHLRDLRARNACVPLILCCEVHDPVLHAVHCLARAGLDALFVLDGGDSKRSLAREVEERLPCCLPATLAAAVRRGERRREVFMEEWALRRAYRKLCLSDIAAWWCLSERQIERRLTALGWPHARDLLGAARLLHVATVLADARDVSAAPA